MIAIILVYALLSLFISATYFKVCVFNMKEGMINGYGSLRNTINGKNHAPAQLRPLSAYIWFSVVKIFHLEGIHQHSLAYEPIRVVSVFSATVATHMFMSLFLTPAQTVLATLIVLVLFVASFKFDYTDNYIDLAIFMAFGFLMLKGYYIPLMLLVLIGSVNRESSSLLPAWFLLQTHLFTASFILAAVYTYGRYRLYKTYGHRRHYGDVWLETGSHCFGKKKLNHGRFNWRENLREILVTINPFKQFKRKDIVPFYSEYLFSVIYLAIMLLLVTQLGGQEQHNMQIFMIITGVQLVHVLPTGCFNEFRIFTFSYPLFGYLVTRMII